MFSPQTNKKPLRARPHHTPSLPSFIAVFVCEGQNVGGTPTAIANHHGYRRVFSEIFQDDRDHVRATFHHKAHDRHALAEPCNTTTLTVHTSMNIFKLS